MQRGKQKVSRTFGQARYEQQQQQQLQQLGLPLHVLRTGVL